MKQRTKKDLLLITALFAAWRIGLFVVAILAGKFLPYKPSFPYFQQLAQSSLPQWLYSFANFDGVHYLRIAEQGYHGTGLIQAFFPVYPLLISLFSIIFKQPIIIGLLISNFSFLASLITGYKLVTKEYNRQTAIKFILILMLFPTSFFFGSLYTESLFLWLVLASFYYIRYKKTTISSLLSGLSSGVRLIGASLLPALSLEILLQEKKSTKLTKFLPLVLSISGLAGYMIFLKIRFDDPFYFFNVQAEFGAGRQESIILWPQVVFRYIKILATARPIDWKYFSYVQDFLFSLGALVILGLSWFKIRKSYVLFALGAYFLPTLTGTFSSMPRYILPAFPIFLWLALNLSTKKPWLYLYLLFSTILLIINTALFVQGYWVA